MKCENHPASEGAPCFYCGGWFCEECTITLGGRRTCEDCKEDALAAPPPPMIVDPLVKSIVPITSNWAALGAFWAGFLGFVPPLSLVGIAFAILGMRRSRETRDGFWRSVVGLVFAIGWTALWVTFLAEKAFR